ncbi:DUF4843 domain-containing protein [Aestuariibaculum sp. M13]|uniref:DUF4843 domain-containing protein n=1 Tax=Aestuariibaculum sp. M13 TaxID=2967132 RepID=UPI002159ED0E|nr:DUF4843 domain-containing protein [Aestuariibaculum sp. M13]MCR8668919.1 DUF4843 domain-containing protein [Aestuariibaculum sp. M13]
MKKIILYITFLCIGLVMLSCEEDKLPTYSAKDSIYYTWPLEGYTTDVYLSYTDSLGSTFAFQPDEVKELVFDLKVSVQGHVTDYDREVKVKVSEASTAIEGVHYSLPEKIVFGANKKSDFIPVTFYKTDDMKDNSYNLILELQESKDFAVDMKDKVVDELTQETLSFSVFQLTINNIIREPSFWNWYWLGDFSERKMLLMSEVLDIPLDYYDVTDDYAEMKYHAVYMQRYLNEKEKAGETIYEEDGNAMVMGSNAQN